VRGDTSPLKGCRQARTAKRDEAEGRDARERETADRDEAESGNALITSGRCSIRRGQGALAQRGPHGSPPPQRTSGTPFPTVPHPDWGPPEEAGHLARGSAQLPAQPHRQAAGSGTRSGKRRGMHGAAAAARRRQVSGGAGGRQHAWFPRAGPPGAGHQCVSPLLGLLLGGGDNPRALLATGTQAAGTQGCSCAARGSDWAREGSFFWVSGTATIPVPLPGIHPSTQPQARHTTCHAHSQPGLRPAPASLLPSLPPLGNKLSPLQVEVLRYGKLVETFLPPGGAWAVSSHDGAVGCAGSRASPGTALDLPITWDLSVADASPGHSSSALPRDRDQRPAPAVLSPAPLTVLPSACLRGTARPCLSVPTAAGRDASETPSLQVGELS